MHSFKFYASVNFRVLNFPHQSQPLPDMRRKLTQNRHKNEGWGKSFHSCFFFLGKFFHLRPRKVCQGSQG